MPLTQPANITAQPQDNRADTGGNEAAVRSPDVPSGHAHAETSRNEWPTNVNCKLAMEQPTCFSIGQIIATPASHFLYLFPYFFLVRYQVVYLILLRLDYPSRWASQAPALLDRPMDSKTGTYMCT